MKRYFSLMLALCLAFSLAACASDSASTAGETPAATTAEGEPETTPESETSGESETAEETASADPVTLQVFAMDTYIDLSAYGDSQEALEEISANLTELENLLSVTVEDSEVYALNHAGGSPVTVSDTTKELITFAQTIGQQTGGALDISIYPLALAWGFTTEDYKIPSEEEIASLLPLVDEGLIQVSDNTVTLPQGMQIDLGAIVKGYACDQANQVLEDAGVKSALLSFGGSTISLFGAKPDGSSWRVAVQDPEDDSSYAGVIEATDCVIDTSGGYERYFTDEDGNVYWHILDPDTGKPADSGLISTTIVSDSGLTGDALSTACFVMGLEDSIEYWKTYGGFEFVFITEDHQLYVSEGLADSFTPVYDYENAELTVVTK